MRNSVGRLNNRTTFPKLKFYQKKSQSSYWKTGQKVKVTL